MKKTITAAILSAAFILTPAAFGEDLSGGYVGIAGGLIQEDAPTGFTADENAGLFRLYGGYRGEAGGALELSYHGFGDLEVSCSGSTQTVERSAISLAALYHFQLGDKFSLFPKVGFAYAEVDDGNEACLAYSDDSATGILFGGGMEFRMVENLAFRADIEKGTSRLDDENFIWSAGLSIYF